MDKIISLEDMKRLETIEGGEVEGQIYEVMATESRGAIRGRIKVKRRCSPWRLSHSLRQSPGDDATPGSQSP
jgi:hypothetical protein